MPSSLSTFDYALILLLATDFILFCIAAYRIVTWINSRQKRDPREVD